VGVVLSGACGSDKKDDKSGAVIKFCNPLSRSDNMPLDLTLEIGSTSPVTLTAASITCTPAAKQACVRVPVGKNVPLVMRNEGMRLTSIVVEEFKAGEEWIALADLTAQGAPALVAIPIPAELMATCADLAFGDIFESSPGPTPDGGATPPTPRM
jgi:hypothetical protein